MSTSPAEQHFTCDTEGVCEATGEVYGQWQEQNPAESGHVIAARDLEREGTLNIAEDAMLSSLSHLPPDVAEAIALYDQAVATGADILASVNDSMMEFYASKLPDHEIK